MYSNYPNNFNRQTNINSQQFDNGFLNKIIFFFFKSLELKKNKPCKKIDLA